MHIPSTIPPLSLDHSSDILLVFRARAVYHLHVERGLLVEIVRIRLKGLLRSLQTDGLSTEHIITLGWRGASDARIRERLSR